MVSVSMGWAGIVGHTSLLLPPLVFGRDPALSMHRWARRIQPVLGLEVTIEGALDLRAPLWAANHLSWVDPVILMGLRPMGTVAKGDHGRPRAFAHRVVRDPRHAVLHVPGAVP